MARRKVSLKRIANDASRRTTFKKRKNGLMKKVGELATLCGVKTCVLVYGEGAARPEAYPSLQVAREMVARFNTAPELGQFKKVLNQEDYLRNRIAKMRDQILKWDRENRDRHTAVLLQQAIVHRRPVSELTVEEAVNLGRLVDTRANIIKKQIKRLGGQTCLAPRPPCPPATPSSVEPLLSFANGNVVGSRLMEMSSQQQHGWLMEFGSTRGGNLASMVYNKYAEGINAITGTSAEDSSGASTSAGGSGGADTNGAMMQFSNLDEGFSWAD